MNPKPNDAAEAHPWLAAIAVMIGLFMVVLDTTVVNVSLPHIAGTLNATVEESTWSLTSYLAANAIILPITGWLSTLIGRRRLLLLSIISFTAASLLCGLAISLPMLILCRIAQGATGGVLQPLAMAVMLEAFPPQERGKSMSLFAVGIVVAPVLGPVLGGWLTDSYSWRWIFFINVPVGVLAVLMTRAYVHDPAYLKRGLLRIDYWGIALLAVGLGALQISLDQGQEEDWFSSNFITTLIVVAAVSLTIFVLHELVVREPVVNLRAFSDRSFAAGTLLSTLMSVGLFGSLVMIPVLLQTLMGYSPIQAGWAMMPRGVGSLITTPVVGLLLVRGDPRKILGAGIVLCALSMMWMAWLNLNASFWDMAWPQFVQGLALGLLFVPLSVTSMDAIPREEMGNASSLYNLTRNIGGSVGIAIVQTMLARDRQVHTAILGAHVDPFNRTTQIMFANLRATFIARGSDAVTATQRAYAALFGLVQRQAAMISFLDAFRFIAIVFVLMVPLVFLMRRPQHQSKPVPAAD